jgi:zinc protease
MTMMPPLRKWTFPAAFLMLLLTGLAGAASEPPRQVPAIPGELAAAVDQVLASKPGDIFVTLKNGMTVLVRRAANSPAVSAKVLVRAGSLYEGPYSMGGLSHYLEHVVSGGTTRSFSEAEAKERLRKIGGASNAFTSHDRTVYYIDTVPTHWQEALRLLIAYVGECSLEPGEVGREKGVIQQEFKLGENNVRRRLWDLFVQTAYQVHPVRNPVIGYEEIFVRQDRDHLVDYYRERYQPQNMVLVVVGQVDAVEVLKFVVEKTKDLQRVSSRPVVVPAEPPQLSPRWREKEVPFARLTQAIVGFPSVTLTHPDLYALDVLAMILGEGRTSRLYQRLKDQEQRVLTVTATNWTPSFVQGQFMISLDLSPQQWPMALTSVLQEVERIRTTLVSPKELERVKKQVIAERIFGRETASSMASSLGSSYLDAADPYFDDAYVEGIRQVTPQRVREVATRYLSMERANVAVIKPAGGKEAPSAVTAATAGDAEGSLVVFNQPQNGLKVVLKHDRTLPIVTVQLHGLGGLILEDLEHPGLARFTASLLTAGTKKRSKLAIAQTIEGVGGSIQSGAGNNTYSLTVKVLCEDLELALDIIADIVLNAQYPEEEITRKRGEFLLAIQRQDEDWQNEVARLFKEHFFPDHPYRNDPLGTEQSVAAVTRADLLAFHRRMVNPAHSVLSVYGDIDLKTVFAKVQQKLAAWKPSAVAVAGWPSAVRVLSANATVERNNDKTTAALFVGTDGLAVDDDRRPALDVLDAVLSGIGYPSGRLQEALRGGAEDLVYVVHGFPFYGIRAGYFGVITQTTLAHLPRVQQIVLDQLAAMRHAVISEEELESAKDQAITIHQLRLESLEAQAQSTAVNEILGLGWNHDGRYPELVRAVTAEDVRSLADKLFQHTLIVRTIPEQPVETMITPPAADRLHPY